MYVCMYVCVCVCVCVCVSCSGMWTQLIPVLSEICKSYWNPAAGF